MLFGDDELFSVARSAKLGQFDLPPVLEQFKVWIVDEFGVSMMHIVFDHIDIRPVKGRPRLNVILESDADYVSGMADQFKIRWDVEQHVLRQSTKLASSDAATYDTDSVCLILDSFANECVGRACSAF